MRIFCVLDPLLLAWSERAVPALIISIPKDASGIWKNALQKTSASAKDANIGTQDEPNMIAKLHFGSRKQASGAAPDAFGELFSDFFENTRGAKLPGAGGGGGNKRTGKPGKGDAARAESKLVKEVQQSELILLHVDHMERSLGNVETWATTTYKTLVHLEKKVLERQSPNLVALYSHGCAEAQEHKEEHSGMRVLKQLRTAQLKIEAFGLHKSHSVFGPTRHIIFQ